MQGRFDWGAISRPTSAATRKALSQQHIHQGTAAQQALRTRQRRSVVLVRGGWLLFAHLSSLTHSVGVCKPGACAICTSQCGTIIAFLPHSRPRLHVFRHRGPLSNNRQLDAGAPPPLSLGGRRIMRQGVCVIGSGFLFVPLRVPPHFLSTKM